VTDPDPNPEPAMTRLARLAACALAALALGSRLTAADPPLARLTVKETSLGRIPPGTVPGSIVVSPDNTRLAYVVQVRGGHRVVLDGREQPVFTYVFPKTLRFSPD
jgi:hypothetical protein